MSAVAARTAPPGRPHLWRRGAWLLLAAVVVVHGLLLGRLHDDLAGLGAKDRPPARIEVAFVRDLQAAAPPSPPAVPAAAPPAAPRLAAVASAPAASAKPAPVPPSPQQATPAPPPELATTAGDVATPDATPSPLPDGGAAAAADVPPEPGAKASAPDLPPAAVTPDGTMPDAAPALALAKAPVAPLPPTAPAPPATAEAATAAPLAAASAVTAAAPTAAGAASATPSFDWPPSTRLSYRLSGHYRGPVEGSAKVEWLRDGNRYQVRMGTAIGPVLQRNIVSEGELTADGLAPRRFTGEQKVIFAAARRWSLLFEPQRVVVVGGADFATAPGVQDEASQFVQLTWLFTTRPERLRVGQSIDMPLVVSRKLNRWTYDVVGEETLNFPFGAVPTFHVKPRREATGSDLTAEIWFAPSLQYLPVRILLRQATTDSWADLMLERAPEQAAR